MEVQDMYQKQVEMGLGMVQEVVRLQGLLREASKQLYKVQSEALALALKDNPGCEISSEDLIRSCIDLNIPDNWSQTRDEFHAENPEWCSKLGEEMFPKGGVK